jgi:lysosomal acid lipase/cholesteryl ester hydrolase
MIQPISGTAQGFSALSMNRRLNKQVNLFVALAPATKPQGIDNKLINTLVNTSPEVIYLLFGRKSVLSSTLFWQRILTPATFAAVIDVATWGLFSWTSEFLAYKSVVYRHLYSYTSVKMVVHWFQIIRTGRFQSMCLFFVQRVLFLCVCVLVCSQLNFPSVSV